MYRTITTLGLVGSGRGEGRERGSEMTLVNVIIVPQKSETREKERTKRKERKREKIGVRKEGEKGTTNILSLFIGGLVLFPPLDYTLERRDQGRGRR